MNRIVGESNVGKISGILRCQARENNAVTKDGIQRSWKEDLEAGFSPLQHQ